MGTFFGILEVILMIFGIILFWGTTWSYIALVFFALTALSATYEVGKKIGQEDNED